MYIILIYKLASSLIFSSNSKALASFSSSIKRPQLFKHIIILNVSLLSLFLSLLIFNAPCEKYLSLNAKVARIAKYLLANEANIG